MRNTLGMFALGLLLIPAAPAAFGGWAVITVQDLPEYLRVGEPTRLEFTIRQHGRTFMDDRSPLVTLKKAGAGWLSPKQRFPGVRTQHAGRYVAIVTPEDTGSVEITIDSDWGTSQVTLLPMPVVSPGQKPASPADPERGRQLFVAEGCITCHVKSDDPQLGEKKSLPVGPELTGRQFPMDWITQKLADPARLRVGTGQQAVMPNLGLSEREIVALASYVNYRQQTAGATVGR